MEGSRGVGEGRGIVKRAYSIVHFIFYYLGGVGEVARGSTQPELYSEP